MFRLNVQIEECLAKRLLQGFERNDFEKYWTNVAHIQTRR